MIGNVKKANVMRRLSQRVGNLPFVSQIAAKERCDINNGQCFNGILLGAQDTLAASMTMCRALLTLSRGCLEIGSAVISGLLFFCN